MHIIAALVAAAGVVLFILYRMQQAATAARDVAEAASDLSGLFRSWNWRRRANVNPLDAIEDPREAAAALMVALAQYDGAVTEAESRVIVGEMTKHFGATASEAGELLARGRWLAPERADVGELMRRLKRVIEAKCGPKERRELIAMLRAVANASGTPDETLEHDIANLEKSLAA
ncbi:MAG TPA: TerB family tellurite resistance protein [Hyphomicrobiaceae bacterium]|nr:TerB family tellurite resistance protein [Hyphomicrobiaceae bacterium]